jgi:Family of unknown function (DUF6444)
VVAIRLGGVDFSRRRRGFRIRQSEDSGSARRAVQGKINRAVCGATRRDRGTTARSAERERRLRLNSLNSSKPPSRDRMKKPARAPARSFQRTAGQAKKSQGQTPAAGRRSLPLGLFWMRRASGNGCEHAQVQTMRWRLVQTACKIVRHGQQVISKISLVMLEMFAAIRERCTRVTRGRSSWDVAIF